MVRGSTFAAPLAVQLHASLPSSQPVGVSIHLVTSAENQSEGIHAFRYAISTNGGPFRTIRDVSQEPTFVWTPQLQEHTARIQLTARNNRTKEMATTEMSFQIFSRTSGKNALVTPSSHPFATDSLSRTIWYLREDFSMTRSLPGGRILGVSEGSNSNNTTKRNQLLRKLDLAGNTLRETNTSRVAEQLESWGIKSDCGDGGKECVSGFHHEAISLPYGHTLAVAGLDRIMPAGTQGSKEAVDILGDIVVDLDEDFRVTAMWNEFDHLDVTRKSYKDAKCQGGGGCCGSIRQLKGGSYASLTVPISGSGVPRGLAIETDQQGKTISALKLEGSGVYRSFRLDDMYSAPIR